MVFESEALICSVQNKESVPKINLLKNKIILTNNENEVVFD